MVKGGNASSAAGNARAVGADGILLRLAFASRSNVSIRCSRCRFSARSARNEDKTSPCSARVTTSVAQPHRDRQTMALKVRITLKIRTTSAVGQEKARWGATALQHIFRERRSKKAGDRSHHAHVGVKKTVRRSPYMHPIPLYFALLPLHAPVAA